MLEWLEEKEIKKNDFIKIYNTSNELYVIDFFYLDHYFPIQFEQTWVILLCLY